MDIDCQLYFSLDEAWANFYKTLPDSDSCFETWWVLRLQDWSKQYQIDMFGWNITDWTWSTSLSVVRRHDSLFIVPSKHHHQCCTCTCVWQSIAACSYRWNRKTTKFFKLEWKDVGKLINKHGYGYNKFAAKALSLKQQLGQFRPVNVNDVVSFLRKKLNKKKNNKK